MKVEPIKIVPAVQVGNKVVNVEAIVSLTKWLAVCAKVEDTCGCPEAIVEQRVNIILGLLLHLAHATNDSLDPVSLKEVFSEQLRSMEQNNNYQNN